MARWPRAALGVVMSIASVGITSCGSIFSYKPPNPTKEHPIAMCQIECKGGGKPLGGYAHMCPSGQWLRDFQAVGEYIVRGADGAMTTNDWVASDGAIYPKEDVELGMCSSVIYRLHPDLALHPGEQPPQYPSSSPPK